ncbi:MAG TPA: c-type cytochrome [Myxococcaceae bacterium]|nr:c-type cytochrome [Myxococcaceae bacterium]
MRSTIRYVTIALGASLFLAGAPAQAGPPDKKIERLWKSKCASCHGEDGKADTEKGKQMKIGDLTSADFQKKRTDEEMKKVINEGFKEEKGGVKKEMDPYKDELKPEQVDALVAYIRGFKK